MSDIEGRVHDLELDMREVKTQVDNIKDDIREIKSFKRLIVANLILAVISFLGIILKGVGI